MKQPTSGCATDGAGAEAAVSEEGPVRRWNVSNIVKLDLSCSRLFFRTIKPIHGVGVGHTVRLLLLQMGATSLLDSKRAGLSIRDSPKVLRSQAAHYKQ